MAPPYAFEIRRARPDEVEVVRSLIIESMGHWDRSPAYLAEATELMSLDADDLARDEAFVLTIGSEVAAFSRVSVSDGSAEIEELHVRPRWIGRGLGRALFEHDAQRARQRGAVVLRWSTDPYALGFYERMGGRVVGTDPSGIAGDDPLTLMEIRLTASPRDHRSGPLIEFREITDANRNAVVAIHAGPAEGRFVSSVADSIEEAAENPEGSPWYRAVYLEGAPVGFVMLSWDVTPQPPDIIGPWFLWKLIVDERHQGRGIGRAIVDEVARLIRAEGATVLLTSHSIGEGGPEGFYERLGFVPTGAFDPQGERILRLDVALRLGTPASDGPVGPVRDDVSAR